ncbi:MAG: tetratricopeptide repeat protein [Terriglobales bacterium]
MPIFLLLATVALAQSIPQSSQTMLVLPFENASKAPGLEWIGEAFAEVLGQRLASPGLYVVPREDRAYAFDRASIPVNLRASRATVYRIAEQIDVDYMVLGRYNFDGQTFTATGQVLDVKRLRLSPEQSESGPLLNLIEIQTKLAWDLLRTINPRLEVSRTEFLAGSAPIRLDALENYIRGITETSRPERIKKLREAVRLNPSYALAMLELGRTYFAAREYDSAASWFSRVPSSDAAAREANFYAGLSYYYLGNFEKAANAFNFLLSQFPLTEVYNNLGVVEARRGKKSAIEYFQKAVEVDPKDPEYHFNLGVSLYRAGDTTGAARELKEAVHLRPNDAEAKLLLEALTANKGAGAGERVRVPLQRMKRNYDETSYRQLALELKNTIEMRLAKTDPRTHASYHVEHGRELLAQGFASEATLELQEAIQLDPTNAAAHACMATILENNEDWNGARNEALAALRLQPSAEVYVVLARLDLRDNKIEAAAANADRALELEPSNAAAQALKRTAAAKMAEKKP